MENSSRRIDAHVHLWRLERGDYSWMTPDLTALHRDFGPTDLMPYLEEADMHEVVLVQAADTLAESEFLLGIAEKTNFVSGVVGWIDMEAPDAEDSLDRLAGNPYLKGIRPMIQDIADTGWMLQDRQKPAFEMVAARGVCFDCLVKPQHLDNLLKLLTRHPDLRAIIDHGAKPNIALGHFDDWAANMKRIASETSAYCKLSGLITEAGENWSVEALRPYAEHLLSTFGPERLVFGSDWPVLTLGANYPDWYKAANVLLAGLDEADRAKIFGENAATFYRL